jgi:Ca2+/H+ antiporter, TMEM165/GDT1 family
MDFVAAVGVAFGAIFLAEFGDKSQLLVLAFATRYPAGPVVAGVVLAAALIQGASVAVGAVAGAALPEQLVAVVAGLAFLAVAVWTLRGDDEDDEGEPDVDAAVGGARGRRLVGIGLALTVAGSFILGELGDKTMLATFALAASQGPLATWIGSTAGEVGANLVAVVVGRQVGDRLSPRLIRIGSATLFALVGVLVLIGALTGAVD